MTVDNCADDLMETPVCGTTELTGQNLPDSVVTAQYQILKDADKETLVETCGALYYHLSNQTAIILEIANLLGTDPTKEQILRRLDGLLCVEANASKRNGWC